jgi:hypothetical protein
MYAFLLLQFEPTETGALLAAGSVGLAAMARTFPILFAVPVVVQVFCRFRWTTGVFAAALCVAPTFFSLYPVYLLTPEGVTHALGYRGIIGGWWGVGGLARLFVSDEFTRRVVILNYPIFYLAMVLLVAGLSWKLWRGTIAILQAGLVLAVGMFCFAPTISNQNFYFLLPWAFWGAMAWRQGAPRLFLWLVCIDLFLIYIVVPLNLDQPRWFQWTYDFPYAGHVPPMSSPAWLVEGLQWFCRIFKRDGLDYNPFIQLVLRMPVWIALWVWFISALRSVSRGEALPRRIDSAGSRKKAVPAA